MLQEGEDKLMLRGMYAGEAVEVYYKCFGLTETLFTDKKSFSIDQLPATWSELFEREPQIQSSYQSVKKWNDEAPEGFSRHYYVKRFLIETHIKSSDNVKLVYTNEVLP